MAAGLSGVPRPVSSRPQSYSTRVGGLTGPRVGVSGPQLGGLSGPQVAKAPKIPKAPGATTLATSPTAPAASTPGPAAPSPYDAQYYLDLAAATNKANQQIGVYNSDIANARTGLGTTLNQLTYNQGLATTRDQNAENARGGFAQGALGQQLGQLNQAYLTQKGADTLKFSQNSAAWNSAIAGVQQGLSIEQIALAAASAARSAAYAAANPSAAPAATGTPAPAAAATQPATTATAGAPGSPPRPLSVSTQPRSRGGRSGRLGGLTGPQRGVR